MAILKPSAESSLLQAAPTSASAAIKTMSVMVLLFKSSSLSAGPGRPLTCLS
jgi:hypothetical protein